MTRPARTVGAPDAFGLTTPGLDHKGQATHPRILAICTLDVMAWKLLRPWFRALVGAGYEVHIACAKTQWFNQL